VLTEHSSVIDLEMSDTEYLELLAQGRDPVREQFYAKELISYGFTLIEAKEVAPLFEKKECSIAEKILVNRALNRVWEVVTRSS
jgi:hypothetical protein